MSESAEVGSVVFEVEAVDADHSRYGQVKYGLVALLANSNSLPEFQIRQNVQGGVQPGKIPGYSTMQAGRGRKTRGMCLK